MKKHADKFGRKSQGPGPGPIDKVRPNHKAALIAARVVVEHDKQHPEPMSLFHKREKSGEVAAQRVKPEVSAGKVEAAAAAIASWDNSDPFAYGRAALHVRQGYLNADDVTKEYHLRTVARKAAKVREVNAMKVDEHEPA